MIKKLANKISHREKCMLICMLLLGVLFMAPRLIMDSIPAYVNQDTLFHILRLSGLKNVWSSPINYDLNTTGSLVNAFYPWLTMYSMQILYMITGDYVISYNIFYCLLSVAGLYISYYSLKMITREEWSSFCFAIIYVFSSYRFTNIYYRAALGEAVSMTFLPLALCGLYRILFDDYKKWMTLSIGMTLIAYSHLISLYLISFFVFFILLISIVFADSRRARLFSFIKATISSVLFSSGMLIQLVYYGIKNDLAHPEGMREIFDSHAYSIFEIIKNSILKQYSFYSIGFAVIMLVVISICLAFAFRKKKLVFANVLIILSTILFIVSSDVIPWGAISAFPFIGVIQFPWRLNAYITMFSVAAFSVYITNIQNIILKKALSLIVLFSSILFFTNNCLQLGNEEPAYVLTDDFIENHLITESLDYIPVDYYNFKNENEIVHLSSFHNEDQLIPVSLNNGNDLGILVTNALSGEEIELPTCLFSTTHIYCDGVQLPVFKSMIGTAMIKAPFDGDLVLDVTNKYDPVIYLFWTVSLVSLCFISFKYVYDCRTDSAAKYNEKCEVNEVI